MAMLFQTTIGNVLIEVEYEGIRVDKLVCSEYKVYLKKKDINLDVFLKH